MNKILRRLACGLALLSSTSSLAQTPAVEEPAPVVRYRAQTNLVLTEQEISGTIEKPSWVISKSRKKTTFRNLIELRSNFRPELSSSKDGL
ncbi:MAG: hypothetical protein Q8O67_26860 [Deltaproteobacteria bacterium]|nr:hypothetical protein [Deltaproteobacteria bacterium]